MRSPFLSFAVAATCLAVCGCSSTRRPAAPLTEAERVQREHDLRVADARKRQALVEVIRVLEIQLADADGEVGRTQALMNQGGAFLEAYNEAYQRREEIRSRLEDARLQYQSLSP